MERNELIDLISSKLNDANWGDCFPDEDEEEEYGLDYWTLIFEGEESEPRFSLLFYSNGKVVLTDYIEKEICVDNATNEEIEKFIDEVLRG